MIKISNKEVKGLKDGTIKQSDFVNDLIDKYTVKEISLAFVELLAMKDAPVVASNKISVTKEELDAIVGLFREKGSSPRGRKRKDSAE